MKLERPRLYPSGELSERVAYLERYLFRLTEELQMALTAMEKNQGGK